MKKKHSQENQPDFSSSYVDAGICPRSEQAKGEDGTIYIHTWEKANQYASKTWSYEAGQSDEARIRLREDKARRSHTHDQSERV